MGNYRIHGIFVGMNLPLKTETECDPLLGILRLPVFTAFVSCGFGSRHDCGRLEYDNAIEFVDVRKGCSSI